MLDSKKYTELALSTKSPHFDNDSINADLLHCIFGLVTESAELQEAINKKNIDEVNIKEEFGDLLWYLAIGFNSLGEDIANHVKNYKSNDLKIEISNCIICSGQLMDVCKRAFYYGKGKDAVDNNKVLYLLDEILFSIIKGLDFFNVKIEEVMDTNIRKLFKRYPNKFSTDSAYIRDLEKERAILEN